jgi:hypothetical protein
MNTRHPLRVEPTLKEMMQIIAATPDIRSVALGI